MTKKNERKDRGTSVKLSPSSKKKLEGVRDALELAYRIMAPPGTVPPKVSQAYTVDAALDMLMGFVSDKLEVYPVGAVQHLMAESGRVISNYVLDEMGEHAAHVELLEDGKLYLLRPSADPIELSGVPDAAAAAAAQPPMAEA